MVRLGIGGVTCEIRRSVQSCKRSTTASEYIDHQVDVLKLG